MTAAWGDPGEAPSEGAGEHIPGEINLGGGATMHLNAAAFRALLHRPEVVRALERRAQEIADAANGLAVQREDRPAPEYAVSVQDDAESTRARARVYPANVEAVLDAAHNLTLLKAMDQHPGDPKREI
jgi:hypothetical protein